MPTLTKEEIDATKFTRKELAELRRLKVTKEEREEFRRVKAYWNSDEVVAQQNFKLIDDIAKRSKIPLVEFFKLFKKYHKVYLIVPPSWLRTKKKPKDKP